MLNLFADSRTTILSASVDGIPYYTKNESRFSLAYWNLPAKGIEVTLQVPTAQPITLTVADQTAGLPLLVNFAPKPRPSHLIPAPDPHFLFSDTAWVKKTYTFTK